MKSMCPRSRHAACALDLSIGEKRSALVGNPRVWLTAPSVLIGLVAATGLGRYALSAVALPVWSTHAIVHAVAASDDVSCFDTSPHKTTFVTVDSGVRLEVLDWGGAGDPMVLLTGAGDNAHVYDEFAFQFTDRFTSSASRAEDSDARASPPAGTTSTRGRATTSPSSTN
jgi:hypothetical protein